MSFESIIGIIASLITIFLAVKGVIVLARKCFLKPPISTLFTQLLTQELTDKERRVILKKLNGYDLINNRIKEQYIQNFALDNRKQEALLFDICDSNDIEPTLEICKNLIGNNMPSPRTKYLEKRTKQEISFFILPDGRLSKLSISIPVKKKGKIRRSQHLLQILRQLILAKPASSLWKVECKLYICQNC